MRPTTRSCRKNGVNSQFIAQFGGNVNFTVETAIPGSFYFWAIQPSTSNPKPADSFIGTFSITADGQLVFVAGPPAPAITAVSETGGIASVSFDTIVGGNYWLASTNQLGAKEANWPIVSGPLVGTGSHRLAQSHQRQLGRILWRRSDAMNGTKRQ